MQHQCPVSFLLTAVVFHCDSHLPVGLLLLLLVAPVVLFCLLPILLLLLAAPVVLFCLLPILLLLLVAPVVLFCLLPILLLLLEAHCSSSACSIFVMREWGKTMGCEGAKIQMISDGNTELSKVSLLPLQQLCCSYHCLAPNHVSSCWSL